MRECTCGLSKYQPVLADSTWRPAPLSWRWNHSARFCPQCGDRLEDDGTATPVAPPEGVAWLAQRVADATEEDCPFSLGAWNCPEADTCTPDTPKSIKECWVEAARASVAAAT